MQKANVDVINRDDNKKIIIQRDKHNVIDIAFYLE